MTEQQSLNLSQSSLEGKSLEMSQGGDLSESQMLSQLLNQVLAQLPEPLAQPIAMAGMMSPMLDSQGASQPAQVTQPQSGSQSTNPIEAEAQPQHLSSGQSLEQQSFDAQSQLSSIQGLGHMIDPMMSTTQQISSRENLELLGAGAQQPLESGQTPKQTDEVRQLAPDVQGKTSPSASSTPMPQKDTSGFSLMPEVFSAETTNLSPTQTSEAANTSATVPNNATAQGNRQGGQVPNQSTRSGDSMPGMGDLGLSEFLGGFSAKTTNLSPTQISEAANTSGIVPSTAIPEANGQGGQVPNQSPSNGDGMAGMGDLSLSEFLPDSAELQRVFEQTMGIVLPKESVLPSSPHPDSAPMGVEAVPQPLKSTPNFYFLPDSKLAESTSSEVSEQPKLLSLPHEGFDVEAVRRDFPILHQQIHGKPLIWMDNAATSQKPQSVIETLSQFYEEDNSNVHRGAHTLAARATNAYEDAREKIQRFLGASLAKEIVFVRGTTEGVNLVAQTYGRKNVKAGDEIVLTTLEHHSNIVPWQMLAQEKGAILKVAPINDRGEILLEEYEKLLSDRTRIVALSHVSNVLGTVLPIKTMTEMAHHYGATVLVDGAQSVPHFRTNVQELGADFYTFSGHKLFGPTGIGVLYGKAALLRGMPPWQSGGNMIDSVSFEKTTFNDIPAKFEAGTGNLAAAVGLGAAIDYLNQIGMEVAAGHEEALMMYATELMSSIKGLRQIGTAAGKVSTLSFVLDDISPEDMGKFLDREGIAVRAGHHCAQPTMKRFGVKGTVRPSLAFYNTFAEVDALIAAIKKGVAQKRGI